MHTHISGDSGTNVAYWPPTRSSCQKKKCTCVNNRCIRSKISDQGMALAVDGLNWVGVEQLYNPRGSKFRSVGEKMLEWEPCPSRGWAPRPPVELSRRTGMKGCDSHKNRGQYIAVLFSLQLTSYTIIPFVTLSNPFKKSERYIFLKNRARSSLLRRYVSACICVCMVETIQH